MGVEHVNKFVNAKTSFIEKVRTMPVSDAMKANFIYKALAIRTWKDPELVDSAIAALSDQRVQNALAALRNIMTADKIDVMSDEEVFTTLEFAAKAIDAATIDAVPEEKRSQGRMDNEDWNVLRDTRDETFLARAVAAFGSRADLESSLRSYAAFLLAG